MSVDAAHIITVLDFRRRRMAVRWDVGRGAGTAHEEAVDLVHGIALIRPSLPCACVYGHAGQLHLQLGDVQISLLPEVPQLMCEPEILSAGLRREFRVEAPGGATLYHERYWAGRGPDFFRTLAELAADPQWRLRCARLWSDGVDPAQLRQGWSA